jgi:hypothetical protein
MCLRVGLAIPAFAIYASAVLSLRQERSGWDLEPDFSQAAAVSYAVYGTGYEQGELYMRSSIVPVGRKRQIIEFRFSKSLREPRPSQGMGIEPSRA